MDKRFKDQSLAVIDFTKYREKKLAENDSIMLDYLYKPNDQVNVIQPLHYFDVTKITDDLKNGQTVIINLKQVDYQVQERIMDFIFGVCYVLNGTVNSISKDIFIVSIISNVTLCN